MTVCAWKRSCGVTSSTPPFDAAASTTAVPTSIATSLSRQSRRKCGDQRFGFDDARIGRPHCRRGVHMGLLAPHETGVDHLERGGAI